MMDILEKELPEFRKAAEEYTKKACQSPESARKALMDSGIYTKGGQLTKHYRSER